MGLREGTTYGSAWMFRMLIKLLKSVSIKAVYAFMAVCVIPVTMVVSPGARLTFHYFRHKQT